LVVVGDLIIGLRLDEITVQIEAPDLVVGAQIGLPLRGQLEGRRQRDDFAGRRNAGRARDGALLQSADGGRDLVAEVRVELQVVQRRLADGLGVAGGARLFVDGRTVGLTQERDLGASPTPAT
jgi:hypothetical protein